MPLLKMFLRPHFLPVAGRAGRSPLPYLTARPATEPLECRLLLSSAVLVKDIAPDNASSGASDFTNVNGVVFFLHREQDGRRTLWKTDGTEAGTLLVRSDFINFGSEPRSLTALGGTLLFFTTDQSGLWRSDGTADGTVRIKPLQASQSRGVLGDVMLFGARDNGPGGTELWRSDGTAAGTVRVKDIAPGFASSDPAEFTAVNGTAYFSAFDGVARGLWKTDGTDAGTALVKAFVTPAGPPSEPAISGLTNVGGTLFFVANDGTHGREVWKSDGTATGTTMVADLAAGGASPSPSALTAVSGLAYFTTADNGLWRSDGTAVGTVRLATVVSPRSLTAVGGNLYFVTGPAVAPELWTTNGTSLGTTWVADLEDVSGVVALNGGLVYAASDPEAGTELWRTDGAGTRRLLDIRPGPLGSSPANLTAVGNVAYFQAGDGVHGTELWRTDGSAGGTVLVKDTLTAPISSNPHGLFPFRDNLFFFASGPEGFALYKSDGTSEGTGPTLAGQLSLPTALGEQLFFVRGDTLYVSDGTEQGARTVKQLPGAPEWMFAVGDRLVFVISGSGGGIPFRQLWSSDGTPQGTLMLNDYGNAPLRNATVSGGKLFFFANRTLIVTDGTPQGTYGPPGAAPGYSNTLYTRTIAYKGGILYNGDDADRGTTLWFSDGTQAGTYKVKENLGLYLNFDDAKYFASAHGAIYFLAPYGGSSLWRTDGTSAGTYEVKAGRQFDADPARELTAVSERVFYVDPIRGGAADAYDLFASDGTTEGTVLIKRFLVQNLFSSPGVRGLYARDGLLYFTAPDDTVWKSDGTAEGTVQVPPAQIPTAGLPVDVNGARFFTDTDAQHGTELWVIPAEGKPAPAAPGALVAAPVSGTQVDLAWEDRSDNESSFRLQRSRSPAFDVIEETVVLLPRTTRYSDSGLTPGTTYYYRVFARNDGGASAAATAATATPAGVPAPPTRLVALPAAGTQSGRRVDLSWRDRSDNETGFVLERSTHSAFQTVDLRVTLPAGTTAYADVAVSRLTTYYYRVTAFNDAGASGPATATVRTPDTVPARPGPLLAAGVTATSVELSWVDNSDNELEFRIERAEGGGAFALVAGRPAGTTTYTDTGRNPLSTYRYRVRAVGAAGPSDSSDEASATTAAPQLTSLVRQLDPLFDQIAANPSRVVTSNGVGYFVATDGEGPGLWRTDGTAGGTTLVKRVGLIQQLTDVDGTLFFVGSSGSGRGIWKSDGTPDGTVFLKDINPGGNAFIHDLVSFKGRLYFRGVGWRTGDALWTSDGTPEGTTLVKDLWERNGGDMYRRLVVLGDTMYLGSDELWKSDGTPEGTLPVFGGPEFYPKNLTAAGGRLYFTHETQGAYRLYTSDGTAAGTRLLRPDLFIGDDLSGFAGAGGLAYFLAADSTHGFELWRTDGTEAGTVMLTDLSTRPNTSAPGSLTPLGDRIAFVTATETGQISLWLSDGTPEGTTMVREFEGTSGSSSLPELAEFGGSLYLALNDSSRGWVLWRSDGTPGMTEQVAVFNGQQRPGSFARLRDILTFTADHGGTRAELWATDGTAAGTALVKDVGRRAVPAHPDFVTAVGGGVFFTASLPSGVAAELWRSDGTAAGTTYVSPVSNLARPFAAGGLFYFTAEDPSAGRELWRSDGTGAGTFRVRDVTPGPASSDIMPLADVNGRLFFALINSDGRSFRLFNTDGTDAGTSEASPVVFRRADFLAPAPRWFAASGGAFYFSAMTGDDDAELWRSDGTPAGTTRVADIAPGAASSSPIDLIDLDGTLYFFARTPEGTYALYRSDGTGAGTVVVKRVEPGSSLSPVGINFTRVGNELFFFARNATPQEQLWRTDGTTAGTVLVKDAVPGAATFPPRMFGAAGGKAYFLTGDAGRNDMVGLWSSDGTPAGTVRIRDIWRFDTTQAQQWPVAAAAAGDLLFFLNGPVLWRTDGTFGGTVILGRASVRDFPDTVFRGAPAAAVGDTVFFGSQAGSGPWELRTAAGTRPEAPSDVTVGLDRGAAALAWDDRSDNESGFAIDRSRQPDFVSVDRTFFAAAGAESFRDSDAPFAARYYYRVRAVNAAGISAASNAGAPAPPVVGRYAFYNRSAFDGNNAEATPQDDSAIAFDKAALLPGQTPTFVNVTSYSRGINGIMIDVVPAAERPGGDDFSFAISADSRTWSPGPTPSSVTVRRGAGIGGSDRVTLVWPDGVIVNRWLRVTVKPTERTGLEQADAFAFGSLMGETGNAAISLAVNALDLAAVKRAFTSAPVGLTAATDFNRDGRVNALDLAVVKRALNQTLLPPVLATAFADDGMADSRRLAEELGLSSSSRS